MSRDHRDGRADVNLRGAGAGRRYERSRSRSRSRERAHGDRAGGRDGGRGDGRGRGRGGGRDRRSRSSSRSPSLDASSRWVPLPPLPPPPPPRQLVRDEFGREVTVEELQAAAAADEARLAERAAARAAAKASGVPRVRKPWEGPEDEEEEAVAAAAAAAAGGGEGELDPEAAANAAAMAAMLGFGSFDSTKGKHVVDNSKSDARGGAVRVVKKAYRQYMNRKGGQHADVTF